jgi:CopG family nickel-responsive transcriptional regulator
LPGPGNVATRALVGKRPHGAEETRGGSHADGGDAGHHPGIITSDNDQIGWGIMQRVTITLDDQLIDEFERFRAEHGYGNRSEAIRDLIRERLDTERLGENPVGTCLASLTYVYNHQARELAARLTQAHHDHHDLAVSTLHVHLDHDNCMETVVLRGPVDRVRAFSNALIAQPGVRHGNLYILPVKANEQAHGHGGSGEPHAHLHLEPIS